MPTYLTLTLVFTLLLAMASWHLIERPAMRLKDLRIDKNRHDRNKPTQPAEKRVVPRSRVVLRSVVEAVHAQR
jgi:peptidoglycan/LPS O-acetylase OafA/YrhL